MIKKILISLLFFFLPALCTAATAGPTFPGTGANNNTYLGCEGTPNAWSNPGGITASGGLYAETSTNGCNGNYLQASNFGFSIPAGATINGISVVINRRNGGSNSDGGCLDSRVRLVSSSGTVLTTDKANTGTYWPTTFTSATYGSGSDLWGSSWSSSDINNSNFGVVLSEYSGDPDGGNLDLCDVDYMTITVTYTGGGGGFINGLHWFFQWLF